MHPVTALVVTVFVAFFSGLELGLLVAFNWGIFTGFIASLIFGLKTNEIESKIHPNQGIWRSLKNTYLQISFLTVSMAVAGGIMNSILANFTVFGLLASSNLISNIDLFFANVSFSSLWVEFLRGILLGGKSGFIIGVLWSMSGKTNSGINCLKHISLRLVLFNKGYIPWNYARFLNDCTECLLLQRVGGRYRFIHKLMQDHFAAMPSQGKG